jgi:type III pantothenate kinase
LGTKTAKLPHVEIVKAPQALGRSSIESIQGGLYYGYLGLVKELIDRIGNEAFGDEPRQVVATGGFSSLYKDFGVFDEIVPDLVLRGVNAMLALNLES